MNGLTWALILGGLVPVIVSFLLRLRIVREQKGKVLLRGIVLENISRETAEGTLWYARVSFPYRGETRTVIAGPGSPAPRTQVHADVSFRWDPDAPDAEAVLEGPHPAMTWAMILSAAGMLLEVAAVVVMLLE